MVYICQYVYLRTKLFQCDQMFHKGIAILWSLTSSIPNQLYNTTIWATMLPGIVQAMLFKETTHF